MRLILGDRAVIQILNVCLETIEEETDWADCRDENIAIYLEDLQF